MDRYPTDKNTDHSYGPLYEELFAPIRTTAVRILELGVFGGGSLRVWRDYFPQAQIFGIDANPECLFEEDRIKTFLANQTDEKALAFLATEFGPFDVIIDDGSHWPADQIASLMYLWPYLNRPGLYVIEDLMSISLIPLFQNFPNSIVHNRTSLKGRHDDIVFVARKCVL